MPTYEYQCFVCNHRFEVFQRMSDEPVKVCPSCHSNSGSVKRLLSAAPFHLKGSGWYKTDYGAKGSSASSTAPSTSKPDSAETVADKPAEKASDTSDTKESSKESTAKKDTLPD